MKKNGFTLIELMLVMGIIGVLAAIAIPKFAKLIAKTNCSKGDQAACDRLAQIEGKVDPVPVAAAPAPTLEPVAIQPVVATIRGRVVKTEKIASDDKPAQYSGVLSLDNGTSMAFTVNDMVIEGTTVCIDINPDRNKTDSLVLCR